MTTKTIAPFRYQGALHANSSKSVLQRALILAALSDQPSQLMVNSWSQDSLAMKRVIESTGCVCSETEGGLHIQPRVPMLKTAATYDVGESGLGLRLLSSVATLFSQDVTLTGHGSLLNRPVTSIVSNLHAMGLTVDSNSDTLPIRVTGSLKSGRYHVDGSFSSQLISGLLIALPLLDGDSEIHVKSLKSQPYIDLTLDIMRAFNVTVTHENYEVFSIRGNQSYHRNTKYMIEGDWSGAANHFVGAAISGQICLTGLDRKSAQADRVILDILSTVGASVQHAKSGFEVVKDKLIPFAFDLVNCPDLFPPLVILATAIKGRSSMSGIHRLQHKESDRLSVMCTLLRNFGTQYEIINDTLIIFGTGTLKGRKIDSHGDHRIAMAGALAATLSSTPIQISNCHVVAKSYPNYFDDLEGVAQFK